MSRTPFPACDTRYLDDPRYKNSGLRTRSGIELIVVHSAEGSSAKGVAEYFLKSTTQASTHAAVDDKTCFRMLSDTVVPWGATGANHDGWHLEICGFAKWSRDEWLAHDKMLRNAAWRCAFRAQLYKIPLRWVSATALRNDPHVEGFVTHKTVNDAFKGGSHWDPGPGFPKDVFMGYVRSYTKEFLG